LATAPLPALPAHAADLTGPLLVNDGEHLQLVPTTSSPTVRAAHCGHRYRQQCTDRRQPHPRDWQWQRGVSANGGQVQLRDATLSIAPATGTGFYALYANGAGSVIDARDVDIDATRNGSGFGSVQAYNGGVIHYAGGSLSMTGTGGTLAGASGKGSELPGRSADERRRRCPPARRQCRPADDPQQPHHLAPGGILAGVAADGVGSRAELYDTYLQAVGSISTAAAACCWRTWKPIRWAAACACSAAVSARPIPAR
jgi:autotransporter family porin